MAKKSSGAKPTPKSAAAAKKLGGTQEHSEEVVRVIVHENGVVARLLAQKKQQLGSSADVLDLIVLLAEIVKAKGTERIRTEFIVREQERAVLSPPSSTFTPYWSKGC
jgi:hypothetical protein